MDLTFSDRETAFRDELRAWFAANDPGPEPVHRRTSTSPGGATSSAASTRAAGPPRTGRSSTAGAARR